MSNPEQLPTYDPDTGSCHQLPSQVAVKYFFATRHGNPFENATARAICYQCPIQEDCLTDAIEQPERYGIRGGEGISNVQKLHQEWRDGPLGARELAKRAIDAQVVLHGDKGSPSLRAGRFATVRVFGGAA